jgi:hypothetical protein
MPFVPQKLMRSFRVAMLAVAVASGLYLPSPGFAESVALTFDDGLDPRTNAEACRPARASCGRWRRTRAARACGTRPRTASTRNRS